MTELATAYVSIVAETSRIAPAVRSALGQADREASRAGQRMGGAMSTALGTALGIGASKAVGAGMSAVSTAFEAGFKRLDAIDQAKGKLSALGASTQTTAKVMDSALAAVKGTAYGLGDAATISASAMAAGVKPGRDLTKYLTMTADAAAIAGTSLGDMGAIFGQVQTGQMAYTDDLNQLADRGIPIYQWLAKEAGVTGGEVKKMAGDGKISSEMFFKAIEANVGGAAKTIGSSTVKGGFENLKAAMGRLGAAAMEPGFNRLPTALTGMTTRIDELTPKAKALASAFDAKVFGEWAPKVREAFEALKDTGVLGDTKETFRQLSEALKAAAPAVGQVVASLGQASAALGVSGWQLFLTALQAGTTALSALNPLLEATAGLMKNNQGVVTGLVAAWLAFKTIPSILGRVTGAITPMTTGLRSATTSLRGFSDQMAVQRQLAAMGGTEIGRFGSAVATLGTHVPVVGRMQGAFIGASDGAQRFGRTAGVAAAAGTGLKAAGSAVAGVFGGPLGLALTGAAIAGTAWAASAAKQKQETEAYAAALKDLSETQKVTGQLLIQTRGAVTDSVYAKLGEQVDEYRAKVDAGAKADAKWTNVASDMIGDVVMGWRGSSDDISASMDEQAGAYQNIQRAMDKTGLTSQQMARALGGSAGDWNTFTAQLRAAGDGGAKSAQDMQGLRDKVVAQQDIGRRLVPGITELGEAFRVMGDKSSSSSDKLNALKTAMDALNPARSKTEAIAQQAEAIRKVADAAQGIGADAFKGNQLDATTESGAALSRTLADLADKQAQLVATGDQAAIAQGAKSMETAFQQLATATGQPIEKIRELYGELGGKAVDLSVRLSGASETVQDLGLIKAAFEQQPDKKTISIESSQVSQQTLAMLDQLHIKWQQSPDGKTIEINAADNASGKLAIVTQTLQNMPKGKAINVSAPGGNDVLGLLREMGAKVHADNNKNIAVDAPLAQDVIDKLRTIGVEVRTNNGKSILVTANDSDYQGKKQDWTRTEYKDIIVRNLQQGTNPMAPGNGIFAGPPSNANGSIRQYANGGIAALESYANGKTPDQALIQKAMPGPGLVQWAEPETGGEAYIPLGKNKRARSQSILATVADMFGLVVMPKDSVPEGVSGWAGALAGIATRGIASGFDGVRKFADGGIVTGQQLRDLANGKGASRPLTGAPYVWGGVNWGDCSGAMSAFARLAAGLSPFGGRFSTAAEADQLAKLGAKSGTGPAGSMRFGWVNGGPGGGHTAGTLPDGTNVEMGGSYGGGMVGGNVGADDPQFTDRAWLPVKDESKYAGSDKDSSSSDDSVASGSSIDSSIDSGYSFDPITQDAEAAGDTSISGRAGNVVAAFVKGQISSLFDVLSTNDQPGWLSALTEYEKQHSENAKKNYDAEKKKLDQDYKDAADARKSDLEDAKTSIEDDYQAKRISADERDVRLLSLRDTYEQDELGKRHDYENSVITLGKKYGQIKGDTERSLSLKQRYESNDLKAGQQLEADKFAREAQLNRDQRSLDSLRDSHAISQSEYERRSRELKTKYDSDVSGMKARYEGNKSQMKSEFDKSQRQFAPSDQYQPNTYKRGSFKPTDPGVNRPKAGEDTGVDTKKSSSSGSVKDEFKSGLREAWRDGQPWTDTDWIITKESSWNPLARNGKYWGLPQAGPEVYAAAGKSPTTENPKDQGEVYDKYVGDRYQTPMGARAHWEAHNWYDQGGIANGIGVMQKNTLKPERVLSPRQTELFNKMVARDFEGGGRSEDLLAQLVELNKALLKQARSTPSGRPDGTARFAEPRQRAALAGF